MKITNFLITMFVSVGISSIAPLCDAKGFSILESDSVHFDDDLMILEGPVVLENESGKIRAKKATLKVTNKKGKFQFHHAILEGDVTIEVGDQLTAKCEKACYNDDTLVLSEDVEVDFGEYGVLKTSEELQLKRESAGGINYIKCLGKSEYRCENDEKNLDLILLSFGEIFLDHRNRKIHLQSDKNSDGVVADDKQLYFRDHLGKIHSDEALIHYEFENGNFSLKTINLDGSVRLVNRGGSIFQYALAEHVTYEHETQQMHFKSPKKKRVLFYDKINNLQVSAPEIKMQRDKQTKKQQFQGIGDVRFHFAEKEYQQLRKRFLLENKSL